MNKELHISVDKVINEFDNIDKKRWCGYGGHFTVPDAVTNRCKEHGYKVRKFGRATKCKGRINRVNNLPRY